MKKTKDTLEMRYYEIPKDDFVLALYGEDWKRDYKYIMHIHNLMEFGICRSGSGVIYLEDQEVNYGPGMITCIPENYIHTTLSDDEDSSKWEYIFLDVEKVLFHSYSENEFLRAEMEQAITEELAVNEPSVIISRRPCALLKHVKHNPPLHVENDQCKSCKMCLKLGCPAISMKDGKAYIDHTQCVGCGICEELCKFGAIQK